MELKNMFWRLFYRKGDNSRMKKFFCFAAALLFCAGCAFQPSVEVKDETVAGLRRGPASYACNPAFPVFGPAIPVTAKEGVEFDRIELYAASPVAGTSYSIYITDSEVPSKLPSPSASGRFHGKGEKEVTVIRLRNTLHVSAGKFVLIQFGGLGSRFYFWHEGAVPPGEADIRWVGPLKNGAFQKLGTNSGFFSGGAPRLERVPRELRELEAKMESLERRLEEAAPRKESPEPETEIILPPEIYAVPGREINVYFDNLFLEDNRYSLDVSGTLAGAVQQNERLKITAEKTGSATLTLTAYSRDAAYRKLAEAKTTVRTGDGAGNIRALFIGDSIMEGGIITQTLLENAAADGKLSVTLYGSRTRFSPANRHEGYGGFVAWSFITNSVVRYHFAVSGVKSVPVINGATTYRFGDAVFKIQTAELTRNSAGTFDGEIACSLESGMMAPQKTRGILSKTPGGVAEDPETIAYTGLYTLGNPFWNGKALSFSDYLKRHGYAVPPDWVFIQLGTNTLFGARDDADAETRSAGSISQLERMISVIRAVSPAPKIGIMLVPPPSRDQDAAGANYGIRTNRDRYKRSAMIAVKKYIAAFRNRESDGIYIVPSNVSLDTVNNMNRSKPQAVNSRSGRIPSGASIPLEVRRQRNLVHPAYSGAAQLGDAVFAFLKNHAE